MSVMPFLVVAAKREQDREKRQVRRNNSANNSRSTTMFPTESSRSYSEIDYIIKVLPK